VLHVVLERAVVELKKPLAAPVAKSLTVEPEQLSKVISNLSCFIQDNIK